MSFAETILLGVRAAVFGLLRVTCMSRTRSHTHTDRFYAFRNYPFHTSDAFLTAVGA